MFIPEYPISMKQQAGSFANFYLIETKPRPCYRDIVRDFRHHDGDDNEEVKTAIGWIGKTTTLHVHHALLYISLPSLRENA